MRRVVAAALIILGTACAPANSADPTTPDNGCEEVVNLAEQEWETIEGIDAQLDTRLSPSERHELTRQTYEAVERRALLAEQHPRCFSAQERVEWESAYRRWQEQMDAPHDN